MTGMSDTAAWARAVAARERFGRTRMRALLDAPGRYEQFTRRVGGVTLDASKQRVDAAVFADLLDLAGERDVHVLIEHMFGGEPINVTEQRSVLHAALRSARGDAFAADGVAIVDEVLGERERMLGLADRLREGRWVGSTGAALDTLVAIGIGGSHLGPAMVVHALRRPGEGSPLVRFVSNVDGTSLDRALADLDPSRTAFAVVSKSFGTAETLLNAESARTWLRRGLEREDVASHFVAVTAQPDRAREWGAGEQLVLWDWVGGRFSLWSSAGFAIAAAIGRAEFEALLGGARVVDQHLRRVEPADNVPLWMALLDVWNHNGLGVHSRAVVPYDERLALLPRYLQQAEMESNGKRTTLAGERVTEATGPVVWGAPGTDAQHAFFQLLHQGTQSIAVDFIVSARPGHDRSAHHRALLSNCLAQSRALAWGRTEEEAVTQMRAAGMEESRARALSVHRSFPGARPSSTLVVDELDARNLGTLIACYEHSVAFKGALWGIPSFDQWGVELGKQMAGDLERALSWAPQRGEESSGSGAELDGATRGLIAELRAAWPDAD
jgi:glucose-6-phosphate isomerase